MVKLVGTDRERIVAETDRLLSNPAAHAQMARVVDTLCTGLAAQRVAEVMIDGTLRAPFAGYKPTKV